jgi:Fur family transcriptional regulator, ferric uptake regulator
MDVEHAATELRAHGFRLTQQREAVLAAVAQVDHGLDPAEILERGRIACPELGLATVYRTLDLFTELGIVRRIHADKGCAAVAPTEREHGHYVVCTGCGRVTEFSTCDMRAVEAGAARETGFSISAHFLELTGVCADCQTNAKSPSEARTT